MFKYTNFLLAFLISTSSLLASQLKGTLTTENPTGKINDGVARIKVIGGIPPYTYKWNKESVKLTSDMATGLTEGEEFSVGSNSLAQ